MKKYYTIAFILYILSSCSSEVVKLETSIIYRCSNQFIYVIYNTQENIATLEFANQKHILTNYFEEEGEKYENDSMYFWHLKGDTYLNYNNNLYECLMYLK